MYGVIKVYLCTTIETVRSCSILFGKVNCKYLLLFRHRFISVKVFYYKGKDLAEVNAIESNNVPSKENTTTAKLRRIINNKLTGYRK